VDRAAERLYPAPHEREIDQLRDRVRLYLQVMLIIDIIAYVSDYVSPLVIEGMPSPDYQSFPAILRWRLVVTIAVAIAWTITRFMKPGRITLIALESGITLGLVLMYIHLAAMHMHGEVAAFAPLFTMFGIMLLLTVRAALVPSPVLRTVLIGLASTGALLVFAKDEIGALDPRVIDGLTFIGGAAVVATGVTSRVIYGLRRQVDEAMKLGQYTLEAPLGEGGMGTVYRARHAMLRRPAAIKLIRPELVGEAAGRRGVLQRFEREADVTANLKSPHTIQLYDFGVSSEGAFYYVMEFLDGVDLETSVATYGPMEPARVVYVLRQVCESLEEAHAAGLVHRDIKPANIFLCRHGTRYDFVKVLDFGLVALCAQSGDVEPKLTMEGMVGGTPAYLPPEMAVNPDAVDSRADVYAVGCVAYWLLTGQVPFRRDTAMATILAHVNDTPAAPSEVSELPIPEALDVLVLECLAKRPAGRPACAAELSRRLEAALDGAAWDQARAARWWEVHNPARATDPAHPGGRETLTVRKALRP
jgi:serine/threonine-protein kinase